MIKKYVSVLSLSMILAISSTINTYAESKYNEKLIKGTSTEISYELNKSVFKKSDEVILINEGSIIDAISVTPLAYAKDAPIVTTKWKEIEKETKDYLKELEVKKITIIGGLSAISKTSELELEKLGYEVQRITGIDRYETSLKIARELRKIKPYKEVMILSNNTEIKDAISIYSYAAKNNIPIIWGHDNKLGKVINFVNKSNFEKVYAMGKTDRFISKVENNVDNYEFIPEIKRREGNIEFLKDNYTKEEMKTMYVINSEIKKNENELDFISLGVVAAKQDLPIFIALEDLTKQQSEFLKTSDVKDIIEVGHEVHDYDLKKIITSKNSIGTMILVVLLIIMYIRILFTK